VKVYQSSFTRQDTALLRDQNGELAGIHGGEGFRWENSLLLFSGIEEGQAVFERWKATPWRGAEAGGLAAHRAVHHRRAVSRDLTGLKAVKDPGFAR